MTIYIHIITYLIVIMILMMIYLGGVRGLGDPYIFLHISSSLVKIRLHTENKLPMLSGSALKVLLGGGGPTNNLVYPNSG